MLSRCDNITVKNKANESHSKLGLDSILYVTLSMSKGLFCSRKVRKGKISLVIRKS